MKSSRLAPPRHDGREYPVPAVRQHTAVSRLPKDLSELRPYTPRVLLIVRILLNGQPQTQLLDKYDEEWRHVKTAVTGHTLRQMGLKPGPEYSVILDKLLATRLDGDVTDEAEERMLLPELTSDFQ